MALERLDNISMHDALDQLNEQKVLLVKEFLGGKSHLLRYPRVFLTFQIQSHSLCHKEVQCTPSATCPHFRFGSDVWILDTRTGQMELQWTLPHIGFSATKETLLRYLDETHAYYDPLCASSIKHVLNGDIPRYTQFYNENFPYKHIATSIHKETHG